MAIREQFNRLLGLDAVNYLNTYGTLDNQSENKNMLLSALNAGLLQRQGIVWLDWCREDYIKKGYQGNAEVYTIVKKIVDKCILAPMYLYIDKEDEKVRKYKSTKNQFDKAMMYQLYVNKSLEFANENNGLQKILDKPNPNQSWTELNVLFDIFYFTQGEAFFYRNTSEFDDKAIELYVAPANLMNPVFGGNDISDPIIAWELNLPGGNFRQLDAKDVFQLKMENPNFDANGSQYRGQSPLLAGLKYLKLNDSALTAFVNGQESEGVKGIAFSNDANPSTRIPADDIDEVQKEWNNQINGKNNKGKIALANTGLGYINLGVSAEALKVIDALKYSNFKLCNLWGLSPLLFSDDVKYDNLDHANKMFVKDVILPYLTKKESFLNRWLVEPFSKSDNKKYKLDYDVSVYAELAPSKEQKEWLSKILTVNEMRIIEGYDTKDNPAYDSVLVSSSTILLDDLGQELNFS